jgi:DNA polymerase III subunit delta'
VIGGLPWIEPLLARCLQAQQSHALLLHGPQGVGQFELALSLAEAWLCEDAPVGSPSTPGCGVCTSCHLIRARSHPDLLVLLPEFFQDSLGWGSGAAEVLDAATDKPNKAKKSKEIKVEAVRAVVAFSQTTSARGRAKVVVLHPVEQLNHISANALLKTLEEPPGVARLLLSCSCAPDHLLPTIRSRCQAVSMALPPTEMAAVWLQQQGVEDAQILLAASGGQPQEVLAWIEQGLTAALWVQLPQLVQQGDVQALAAWPLPRLIDALQKLCHDAACVAVGAPSRYFPAGLLKPGPDLPTLMQWMRELNRCARHAEHPWNAALMLAALVQQGQHALQMGALLPASMQPRSVDSFSP